MNFLEAISLVLSETAHNNIDCIWPELRVITDRYSFKCRSCRSNRYFRDVENTLRWFTKKETNTDICDLWARCRWITKTEIKCKNCKFKIE